MFDKGDQRSAQNLPEEQKEDTLSTVNVNETNQRLLAAAQQPGGLIEQVASGRPQVGRGNGAEAAIINGFAVTTQDGKTESKDPSIDTAERPVNSGSPADKRLAQSRQPQGPLTEALNSMYDRKTDSSGLADHLSKSQMTPDELKAAYSRQPKAGYPPVEAKGDTLNIYDRDNKQYSFSYDAQKKTYKLEGTHARGSDGYDAPERLRNQDADAFSYAIVASLKRNNRNVADIATEITRFVQLSMDRGVPLRDLAESINRSFPSDKPGHSAAHADGPEGNQTLNFRAKGVNAFTLEVTKNGNSSTVKVK